MKMYPTNAIFVILFLHAMNLVLEGIVRNENLFFTSMILPLTYKGASWSKMFYLVRQNHKLTENTHRKMRLPKDIYESKNSKKYWDRRLQLIGIPQIVGS